MDRLTGAHKPGKSDNIDFDYQRFTSLVRHAAGKGGFGIDTSTKWDANQTRKAAKSLKRNFLKNHDMNEVDEDCVRIVKLEEDKDRYGIDDLLSDEYAVFKPMTFNELKKRKEVPDDQLTYWTEI